MLNAKPGSGSAHFLLGKSESEDDWAALFFVQNRVWFNNLKVRNQFFPDVGVNRIVDGPVS